MMNRYRCTHRSGPWRYSILGSRLGSFCRHRCLQSASSSTPYGSAYHAADRCGFLSLFDRQACTIATQRLPCAHSSDPLILGSLCWSWLQYSWSLTASSSSTPLLLPESAAETAATADALPRCCRCNGDATDAAITAAAAAPASGIVSRHSINQKSVIRTISKHADGRCSSA
jgi:hypothetical protein